MESKAITGTASCAPQSTSLNYFKVKKILFSAAILNGKMPPIIVEQVQKQTRSSAGQFGVDDWLCGVSCGALKSLRGSDFLEHLEAARAVPSWGGNYTVWRPRLRTHRTAATAKEELATRHRKPSLPPSLFSPLLAQHRWRQRLTGAGWGQGQSRPLPL